MRKHLFALLGMLGISALLVAGCGIFIQYRILAPLDIQREENCIALPFVMLADAELQARIRLRREALLNPTEPSTAATTMPETTVTEPPTTEEPTTEPPTTEAPTTEPEPTWVQRDESWFDDALFIGESRTTGLRDVSRLGGADYFCEGSVTVYGILGIKSSDYDFRDMDLPQLLYQKKYGKIYIHLGLNECLSSHDDVMAAYKYLTDFILETQPDAKIIVQAVMAIGRQKEMYSAFSLERVNALNDRLRVFAEEEGFFFSDVNEFIADAEGYLPDGISSDGCHPYASYYTKWAEWLLESAGWLEIP